MLKLPSITKEELEIFKNKKVIIYHMNGGDSVTIYKILKNLGLQVIGVYTEKESFIGCLKQKIKGGKMVNVKQLDVLLKKHNNLIIQGNYRANKEFEIEMREKMQELGCDYSEIEAPKLISTFGYMVIMKQLRNPILYYYKKYRFKKNIKTSYYSQELEEVVNRRDSKSSIIIMCSPPKTADYTLNYTMEQFGQTVNYFNVSHKARVLKPYKHEKLKLIMGVREPISQNLSLYYHELGSSLPIERWILDFTYNKSIGERNRIINQYETLFLENGDNIQVLWYRYIERFIYPPNGENISLHTQPLGIQEFIREFQENVFDILTKPFDKEKGCDILREGNIDVFVYQLEKLNSVIPELSDFVGVPFTTLVDGNKAEDKWIGESYKQACKEIEITQEYFDKCYNEPYVKHFYSEEDIEKFKERWRSHIV